MIARRNSPVLLAPVALLVSIVWSAALLAQAPPPPAPTPAPARPAAAVAGGPIALCGDCHTDQAAAFARNPHVRPFQAHPGPSANSACESCHGDGARHMEAGGDATLIRRFRDYKAADFCTTCHRESTRHASFTTGMHANRAAVNCLSCHSIHSSHPRGAHLNVKPTQELCAGCHPTQDATIRQKPFTHRPIVGVMDCASCHDPHGRPGQESLRLTRTGEPPCLSCHSEKRGPFVFEHPTGQSVSSAADCYRCHETHGSSNPKMLVRARVFQLCLECHSPKISPNTLGSQPPSFHNISLPRYRNCTTCHVAIHGSNVSPTLFK